MTQAINPLPFMVQAPRLFAGGIKLGGVMQSANAFGPLETYLSFFRNAYDRFASYRASIIRLSGLVEANAEARELPELSTVPSDDGSVELADVEVHTPDGAQLIGPLDLRLVPGDALIVTGRSGSGKTALLRTLAQLWPYASGTLRCPDGANQVMFLSQLPYVPLGWSARRRVLSSTGGRNRRQHTAGGAPQGRVAQSGHPPRRSPGLVEGALARRAATHRVRAAARTQTQSGIPRRSRLRCRRSAGVSCCTTCYALRCRTASWSASATAAPSNNTITASWHCSATGSGTSDLSPSRSHRRNRPGQCHASDQLR